MQELPVLIGIYKTLPESVQDYLCTTMGEGEWYYIKTTYADTRETVFKVYSYRPVRAGLDTMLRLQFGELL